VRGEQVKQSKLTAEDVEEIRSARRQRNHLREHIKTLSNEALAARYKVTVSTIEVVIAGTTWKHV
jgi:uncharacterized coiled-coil DUF342 family protein